MSVLNTSQWNKMDKKASKLKCVQISRDKSQRFQKKYWSTEWTVPISDWFKSVLKLTYPSFYKKYNIGIQNSQWNDWFIGN